MGIEQTSIRVAGIVINDSTSIFRDMAHNDFDDPHADYLTHQEVLAWVKKKHTGKNESSYQAKTASYLNFAKILAQTKIENQNQSVYFLDIGGPIAQKADVDNDQKVSIPELSAYLFERHSPETPENLNSILSETMISYQNHQRLQKSENHDLRELLIRKKVDVLGGALIGGMAGAYLGKNHWLALIGAIIGGAGVYYVKNRP